MPTSEPIISTLQYKYDNPYEGYSVTLKNLDFSKAFDRVDHEFRLHNLRVYGVRGFALDFLGHTYLRNMHQNVNLKSNYFNSVPSILVLPKTRF